MFIPRQACEGIDKLTIQNEEAEEISKEIEDKLIEKGAILYKKLDEKSMN